MINKDEDNMSYAHYFKSSLAQIRAEHRYRVLRVQERGVDFPITRIAGIDAPVTTWCGVDYLGFTQLPILKTAAKKAIEQYGVGSGGTRTIGGTNILHVALEEHLATWHHKPAALLFNTGYVANEATLSTLSKIIPNITFISDAENHMSIIEGIRQANTNKLIFKHNDLEDLENKLQSLPLEHPKIIVFESVYSMSGDISPVCEIVALAKKYNALTFLDEVHAIGIYGKTGAGISELEGVASDIDIIQGTLSKGLGIFGGYIAADQTMIDCIRLNANGFIFTVSLPPVICAAAIAAIDYRSGNSKEATALLGLVDYLHAEFQSAGFTVTPSHSHITPIIIGDSKRCQEIADRLLSEFNIYIQAINYPTVRRGEERLRISPTALHTKALADKLISALKICLEDKEKKS